jgi:hypothetical protein
MQIRHEKNSLPIQVSIRFLAELTVGVCPHRVPQDCSDQYTSTTCSRDNRASLCGAFLARFWQLPLLHPSSDFLPTRSTS